MTQPSDRPWWQTGVIYQIYPRSFQDQTGDGVGDLPGLLSRLDYLRAGQPSLGVDAIWISPFYPSPLADFGYDVADYCNVDPQLGDLAVFDRLVAEAHQRGLRVIVDYVPNHTSDQHAWFQASRRGRDDARRDWYIWRDPAPGGGPPNNWGSVFGGPAWTWDAHSGQYYFHQFLKEQPDLNWRNPDVRAAMLDVLRFWLERGVDGFRMDVVGMLFKHPDMPDQPLDPHAPPGLSPDDIYARQQHLYDQDQDEIYDLVREFRRVCDPYGDICLIGETLWHGHDRWVRYYGEHGEGLHLPMNFNCMEQPWNAEALGGAVAEVEARVPASAWPSYVLGNHDRARLATRYGQAGARLAALLLLSLRGTPILYYGDELGLENGQIDPAAAQDPWGINLGPERNRDVARTPMQWSATPQAGFSAATPWLPVSADFPARNVAAQAVEPGSLLNLYRRLLALRAASPVLQSGAYRPLPAPAACLVYARELNGETVWAALNFEPHEAHVTLPGAARLRVSTHLDRDDEVVGPLLMLRAHEGALLTPGAGQPQEG